MRKKKTKRVVPFEKIKAQYASDFAVFEHEVRRDEFKRIVADPTSHIFGKTVEEVKHALDLSETSSTAAAYKKGFGDALNTIKTVAELEINRLKV